MIGHLKNKINCICFINTNAHLVRNYFEKVTLDRDEVQSQCLQVEIANTSQMPFTKKGLTTQRVYKVKQRCRMILNLEKMR